MAVRIQGKLNELINCQKTDGSIQIEYNQISRENQQNIKDTVQNVVTQVKDHFISNDDGR